MINQTPLTKMFNVNSVGFGKLNLPLNETDRPSVSLKALMEPEETASKKRASKAA